jgi:hypothetical protein
MFENSAEDQLGRDLRVASPPARVTSSEICLCRNRKLGAPA